MHHRQPEREEREKRETYIDPKGYDTGKKVSGKKRHTLVDTESLLMHAIVHKADVQERDGGVLLFLTLFGFYPFLRKVFADGGYQGLRRSATALGGRADVRMAWSVPAPCKRFREQDTERAVVPQAGVDPAYAQEIMQSLRV